MPAARAPGTRVSPSASRVAACPALNVRNGTPWARAARGVSITSAPLTENASAPAAAPLSKARRSMSCIMFPPSYLRTLQADRTPRTCPSVRVPARAALHAASKFNAHPPAESSVGPADAPSAGLLRQIEPDMQLTQLSLGD